MLPPSDAPNRSLPRRIEDAGSRVDIPAFARTAGGKSKDRYGNPMTVKVSGKVEVFYVEGCCPLL
jgi:hypothetical protein